MPAEEIKREKLAGRNFGTEETRSEIYQPGTAFLDYYTQGPSKRVEVFFIPHDSSTTATIEIDRGPEQPLTLGFHSYNLNHELTMTINNAGGKTEYGWRVTG
jgi:hypothetical protein